MREVRKSRENGRNKIGYLVPNYLSGCCSPPKKKKNIQLACSFLGFLANLRLEQCSRSVKARPGGCVRRAWTGGAQLGKVCYSRINQPLRARGSSVPLFPWPLHPRRRASPVPKIGLRVVGQDLGVRVAFSARGAYAWHQTKMLKDP